MHNSLPIDNGPSAILNVSDSLVEQLRIVDLRSCPASIANSDTMSKPATTFHNFGGLPRELRHKIWKYALPEPRLVKVYLRAKQTVTGIEWFISRKGSRHDNPTLLRVSSEARWVSLEHYHTIPILIDTAKAPRSQNTLESFLYVDGKVDTVLAIMENTSVFHRQYLNLDLHRIENLAVLYKDLTKQYAYFYRGHPDQYKILDTATNLKSLSIVQTEYTVAWLTALSGRLMAEPWLDVDDTEARFITIDPNFQANFLSPYTVHGGPVTDPYYRQLIMNGPVITEFIMAAQKINGFVDSLKAKGPGLANVECKAVLYSLEAMSQNIKTFEEYCYGLALKH